MTFRRVPEGGIENYSFLNFFLPDEASARRVSRGLAASGFDGVFYWYDNNWHYHRKWEHLKNLESLNPLPPALAEQLATRNSGAFEASDQWMGRNLSVLIKLSWDDESLEQRGRTLREVVSASLVQ